MLTHITGIFRTNVNHRLSENEKELLTNGVTELRLTDEFGNTLVLEVDELNLTQYIEEDEDINNCELYDLSTKYEEIRGNFLPEDISLVLFKGYRYIVVRVNSTIHLMNERTGEIEYTLPCENLIKFLREKDKYFTPYRRGSLY